MQPSAQDLNNNFELFIGVDQTGAVYKQGAKPMPVALVLSSGDTGAELVSHDRTGLPLFLNSFCFSELCRIIEACGLDPQVLRSAKTAILVDCVFGLAEGAWPSTRTTLVDLFARAARWPHGFGLRSAAKFFDEILSESGSRERYPVRKCEQLARANSVFRTQPYQKNIQCGTFRIWRDLGLDRQDWFHVRYFTPVRDAHHARPWIFESYPSLIWRQELGVTTRNLSRLGESVALAAPELRVHSRELARAMASPDAADSMVLAIGGYLLQKKSALITEPLSRDREGWIVGLERSK